MRTHPLLRSIIELIGAMILASLLLGVLGNVGFTGIIPWLLVMVAINLLLNRHLVGAWLHGRRNGATLRNTVGYYGPRDGGPGAGF